MYQQWRMIAYTLAIAGCAGQAGAQELTGTLKNIKETGAITLGYRELSIPFSYLYYSQKPVGYAMDICYKIVDAVKKELKLDKLEVKLNPVSSSARISADGQRDHRPRMRIHDQQHRPAEAGGVHQYAFPDGHPGARFQEVEQARLDRRSQGQAGGLHLGHHQHQAAHRGQRGAQPRHQHHSRQGACRVVPARRNRPCGRGRAGRHPARRASSRDRRTRTLM